MQPEPIRIVHKVISAFDQLDIPYLVGGSLASAVHGLIRSTLDADLIAEVKPDQVLSLCGLLEKDFYIDPEMILDAIIHRTSFNLIHIETMFKVDIFLLKNRQFDRNEMERRSLQPFGDSSDEPVYVSTAEDIILAKLEWYRLGGEMSDRQWRDIQGILKIKANQLDFDYLKEWSSKLSVNDLLQRALQESGVEGKRGTN